MSDGDRLPAYVPDKEELRSRLSLEYVCAKLGVLLDREGRARCPFHEDSSPSFYLWDGDDGKQRWHCQPCGFGGDLFDLIQRVLGLSFSEAVIQSAHYLAELPPDYIPPKRDSIRIRPTPDAWQDEVQGAIQNAAASAHTGILAFRSGFVTRDDPDEVRTTWDTYLRGTWGWGIGTNGTVYMPHWTADGRLTGCKLRPLKGRKESLPGSQYESLYGSWLGRRHRDVLLAEGETDAVYAAWLAAQENVPIDVYGLPSGANRQPEPAWLDFLRGSNRVFLAYDPDAAGVEATRNWITALGDTGFQDVRVCCLPLGRDLRETQPSLRQLLGEARKPLALPEVLAVHPGGFVFTARNGNLIPVTTWTVDPVAQLSGEGEPGFDAILRSRGTEFRTVIRLADLATTASLNKWANAHGEIFTASDAVRATIAMYVKARGAVTPEVFQTDRVGLHEPPERYHFAGPSVVLPTGYIGQMPFRYAPTNRAANVSGRLFLPVEGEMRWRWLEAFLKLSDPSVTEPFLAWLVAAARRPEVVNFPLLFIGGSSGVGKSTIARLGTRLLGSGIEIDLGANTPFVLYRTLSASSSLPIFVDEWTRLSRQDTREAFQGVIPLLYTGGLAERGTADLTTHAYRMTAPTIVAGEDTFTLDREMERTVCLYPTRATQNVRALAYIQDAPIERFGQMLHLWIADRPALPPFPATTDDRVDYNREVLRTGWATLHEFLDMLAGLNVQVPDISLEPDLSCFEHKASETDEIDENVYMNALIVGQSMTDPSGSPVVWNDPQGEGVWVRAETLIGLLETRRVDIQLPGRSRALRAYFAERYGQLVAKTVTPPLSMRPVRAHLIPSLQLDLDEDQE